MKKSKRSTRIALFTLSALSIASSSILNKEAHADITALDVSQTSVQACKDYFTSEWATPIDMNEATDVLYNLVPREVQQLGPFSFSNGIFSTSANGNDPYFRLLTWVDHFQGGPVAIPDDTTRFGFNKPIEFNRQAYRNFSFRMYSNVASDYQILWDKHEGSFGITTPTKVYPGWHTYSIDLATAGLSDGSGDSGWTSGKVVGIRVDPVQNSSGAEIKFDWAQLTPAVSSCASIDANYTTNNQDLVNLILDDNSNPLDGVLAASGPLTSGTGTASFSTVSLFPGNLNLYGIASKDYASLNLAPWDMDDGAGDVDSNRIFGISKSGTGFGGGSFCGTTTMSNANFYLSLPLNKPIDSSKFNKVTVQLQRAAGADSLVVTFFDTNGTALGDATTPTNGSGVYQIDLSGNAQWSGQIGSIRIIPITASGLPFCVDWVSIGSAYAASEPVLSAAFNSARNPQVVDRPVSTFVQPDREGGEDFFVNVRGRPSDMSSTTDIQHADNLTEAWIYPGNAYVDSSGATKVGDFFQAQSRPGSDDPTNFSVFLDNSRAIDPTKYKIACFTLDVLAPVDIYHSVARILWQHDSKNIDGDDLVLKTSGEARYCLRMDTLQVEPNVAPGPDHPWKLNSDGTGINYWRIDAHEETNATSFRIQDVRLAADHVADDKFQIVVSGSRDKEVTLYYSGRSDGTQGSAIGTLPAGRNTDTFLWNTTAIPDGAWFLYLTVGAETYLAPGAVIVRHQGNPDAAPPILGVDAPLNQHRFTDSLELAGFAIDNVRVATIEAFLNGQIISAFSPSQYRKAARDAYPAYPNSSDSGFQHSVAVPNSFGLGSHTLTIKVYDTVGNMTQYDSTVERVASDPTASVSYPIPNEARIAVPIQAGQPAPSPTTPPSTAALTLKTKVSASSISVEVGQANGCANVEVLANVAPNKDQTKLQTKGPKIILSAAPDGAGNLKGLASKLKSLQTVKSKKVDTKIYMIARCDGARHSPIVKADAKKIKKAKAGQVKNVKSFLGQLKSKMKKS